MSRSRKELNLVRETTGQSKKPSKSSRSNLKNSSSKDDGKKPVESLRFYFEDGTKELLK